MKNSLAKSVKISAVFFVFGLAFFLHANNALAAFAQVQTSSTITGTNDVPIIPMTATTANNLVVVHIRISGTATTVNSVTDNKGNVYALNTKVDNTIRLYQAYGVQTTGGATSIIITLSGSATYYVGADEYSGAGHTNGSAVDTTTNASGTSTTPATATLTAAATGELIVATGGANNADTWTQGTNYTNYNGSGSVQLRSEYRLSGAATETAPWTIGSSQAWAEIVTAFKPFSGCSSAGTGAWATGGTWAAGCHGTGGIPASGDEVTILNGHNVTIATGVAGVATSIIINSGGTLTITSTGALTATGDFTDNGTLTGTGALTLSGTSVAAAADKAINGSGVSTLSGTITLTNNKTISSSTNLTISGAVTVSSGTTTNNGIITINGALTLTGGWTQGKSATLSYGSTTALGNAGVGTFSASTGVNIVNYSASGAQTCKVVNYALLIFSGSGAKTCALVGGTNSVASIFLQGTATWTLTTAPTINNQLTIGSGTTVTVGAFAITVSGMTTVDGTLAITSTTGTKSFKDIIINTGGTLNNSGNTAMTVLGDLQVNGTGTLTAGSGVWTFSRSGGGGDISGNGSSTATIGSATFSTTYTTGDNRLFALNQFQSTSWAGMAIDSSNHNVYTAGNNGDLYERTAGTGSFTTLSAGTKNWIGITVDSSNQNVYATVEYGDIYKCTNATTVCAPGTATFTALGQTARDWQAIAVDSSNHDVYAVDYTGDIYVQAGGSGNFVALNQTHRSWIGVAVDSSNHNVYALDYGGNVYKCTNATTTCDTGTPTFATAETSPTARNWEYVSIDSGTDDVYTAVYGGDIYKQTAGSGNFVALGQTPRNWWSVAIDSSNKNIYAGHETGDIFEQISGTTTVPLSVGTLTPTATVTNLGTDTVTGSLGSGTFTNSTNATLNLSTATISATLTSSASGNTVNYNLAGIQTVKAGTYVNLGLGGSSAKTLSTGTTYNGNLTITNVQATSVEAMAIGGNLSINGPSGTLITGATNTWTLSVAGTTTITGGSLTLNNTANKTFTGAVTINSAGAFTIASGATLTLKGGFTNNSVNLITVAAPTTFNTNSQAIAGGSSGFTAYGQTNFWQGLAVNPSNHNVYVTYATGDIWMQTAETGAFVALGQTSRSWRGIGIDSSNNNAYATVDSGDIYKQTAGSGTFTALSQTTRAWRGIAVDSSNQNVYAAEANGDLYKCTNATTACSAGTASFVALGQTGHNWAGVAVNSATHDVYATDNGGDIYKQTGGTGSFVAQGQTARNWSSISVDSTTGDVYATDNGGLVYKQTGGTGSFTATTAPSNNWVGVGVDSSNQVVYVVANLDDIYSKGIAGQISFTSTVTVSGAITVTNNDNGPVKAAGLDGDNASSQWTQGSGSVLSFGNATHPFNTLGSMDVSTNPNTVIYTGSNTVTCYPSSTYYNLSFTNAGIGSNQSCTGLTNVTGNLSLSGSGGGSTSFTLSSNLTVGGQVNLASGGSLAVGAHTLNIGGTNTPLNLGGSLSTASSTINFTGNGAAGILATTYNNLGLKPSGSTQQVLGSGTFTVNGNLTIGDGTNTGATAATNNPTISLLGNLTIAAGATYTKGSGTTIFKGGTTETWTDNTSGQDIGAVQISAGGGATTVNLASSAEATSITIDSSQIFSFNGSNTLTLTSASSPIIVNGTLTVSTGTINYTPPSSSMMTVPNLSYYNVGFNSASSTFNLGGTLTATNTVTLTAGTLNSNNNNITTPTFSSSNSNTRALTLGSSTLSLTGTGTVWDMSTSTGATITPSTSTIKLTDTSSSGKIFKGGGLVYNNIWYAPGDGSGHQNFAQVQTSAQTSGTGTSAIVTTSATAVNNLVVIHVKITGVSTTVSSVTDNVGNAYIIGSPVDESTLVRMYQIYGVQTTGGTTSITINFSGSSTYFAGADEYSGGKTTNATVFDTRTSGINTGGTKSFSVSTLTPASIGELIVASAGLTAGATWTVGTNYTNYNGTDPTALRSEYRLSSASSETAPWTLDSFLPGAEIASAFKYANNTNGDLTITGNNTFNDFKDDGTVAHSILFTAGSTTHVTTFTVTGTSGQLITINSGDGSGGTSTSTHTLVKDNSGSINTDYLNIQHSIATPYGTWYAGTHSTSNQSVATTGLGWVFNIKGGYLTGGTDVEVSATPNVKVVGGGIGGGGGVASDNGASPSFAQVQTSTQASGTGSSAPVTMSATGVNNLVIVHIRLNSTSVTVNSITDNQGNTYVVGSPLDSVTRVYQGYGVQTTGGVTSITINFSGSVGYVVGADEYRGGAHTNATVIDVSQTGTDSGSTKSLSVSTITPSKTGELIVVTAGLTGTATWTQGTNYINYNGNDPTSLRSEYRLSSAASETAPWTIDGFLPWAEIGTAFKAFVNITTGGGEGGGGGDSG